MKDEDNIRRSDAAKLAAKPGLTESAARERFRSFERAGVIPPAVATEQNRGDPTLLFPMAYGAAFAVMSDLYDAGLVRTREHLATLFRFLAIPDDSDGQALIVHLLASVAAGEPCWLVMTCWRDPTGDTVTGCAVRFADEMDRPIEGPTPDHEPFSDHVIKLHLLLSRFTERPAVN